MNTNKSAVVAGVLGGALVGLLVGFVLYSKAPQVTVQPSADLGAANVTASNALDQQSLVNELNLIANPLVAIYSSSSANFGITSLFGPTGTTTSTASTTLSFTNSSGNGPFLAGDAFEVGFSTSTQSFAFNVVYVNSSTVQIMVQNLGSVAGASVATTTLYLKDLPQAAFVAPTGL